LKNPSVISALGRAPAADLVMLGCGRSDRREGKRESGDCGDSHGRHVPQLRVIIMAAGRVPRNAQA
jgi:hypothetical protein